MNIAKIKGRMAEKDIKQKDIAKALGISPATVSQKLSGVRPLMLDEAETIAKVLGIDNDQFGKFFLTA